MKTTEYNGEGKKKKSAGQQNRRQAFFFLFACSTVLFCFPPLPFGFVLRPPSNVALVYYPWSRLSVILLFTGLDCLGFTLDSLPFRFKGSGGANMAPTQTHHHRSTTKKANKSYKSRHASKGALKEQDKGA